MRVTSPLHSYNETNKLRSQISNGKIGQRKRHVSGEDKLESLLKALKASQEQSMYFLTWHMHNSPPSQVSVHMGKDFTDFYVLGGYKDSQEEKLSPKARIF